MARISSRRLVRTVVVTALTFAIVAAAAYATWPGRASRRHIDRASTSTCDYASADWMQQPGCERPPSR